MKNITIITGKRHSGKTTKLNQIVEQRKKSGEIFSGFLAYGKFKDNQRHSFYLQEINTKEKKLFLTVDFIPDTEKVGRFYINNQTLNLAKRTLEKAINQTNNTIVIDEIGPMELKGKVWADLLRRSLQLKKRIIITVRKELLDIVCKEFDLDNYYIINI